ncbi:histidine kinase, partial [Streptomyces fungicidicus]
GSAPAHGAGGVSAPGDDWPSHGGSGAAHGAGLGAEMVRPGGADVPGGGRERAGAGGGESGLTGDDAPLPRRVRQASLVDELRVDPAAGTPLPRRPPRWQDDPMLRPVPRRAGATIGAFQRRSRAAREGRTPTPPESSAPGHPTREEES